MKYIVKNHFVQYFWPEMVYYFIIHPHRDINY